MASTTLNVIVGYIILQVYDVLKLGELLLEGCIGKIWKDHTCNYVLCHLPHIDGHIDTSVFHISTRLKYVLCGTPRGLSL
jgi:hypothetical protein